MAAPPAPPRAATRGGGLTRKVGPLPVWGWLLAVALIGYMLYRRYKSSSTTSQVTGAATDTLASPADNGLAGSGALGAGTDGSGGGGGGGLSPDLAALFQQDLASQQATQTLLGTIAQTNSQLVGALAAGTTPTSTFSGTTQAGPAPVPAYTPAPFVETSSAAHAVGSDAAQLVAAIQKTTTGGSAAVAAGTAQAANFLTFGGTAPAASHPVTGSGGGPSGAAAVRKGTTKTNFQAKRNAL